MERLLVYQGLFLGKKYSLFVIFVGYCLHEQYLLIKAIRRETAFGKTYISLRDDIKIGIMNRFMKYPLVLISIHNARRFLHELKRNASVKTKAFCKVYLLFIFLFYCACSFASDLEIEGIEWSRSTDPLQYKIKCTVSWGNSWRNDKNYDAAWMFLKYVSPAYQQASYRHAKLMAEGHRLLINHIAGSPDPVIEIAEDRIGFFIYASAKYRGSVRWTIELALDTAILHEENFNPNNRLIDVFGIEMVQIPPGAYTLGESDTAAAWKNYSLFASDGNGRPAGCGK